MTMIVSLSFFCNVIHRVWIMWITYPHFVWISDIHRFFRIGMWITFECIFCKPWTFAHLGGVIHIFCQFIHHRLLTTGEKSAQLGKNPQNVIHRVWIMWITYPHFVWISLIFKYANL